jgi:hypothetical protein
MFKQKFFFVGILKVNDEKSRIRSQDPDPDPNPDPFVRGMDPRIRIRIHSKLSWIRNTAMQGGLTYCNGELGLNTGRNNTMVV